MAASSTNIAANKVSDSYERLSKQVDQLIELVEIKYSSRNDESLRLEGKFTRADYNVQIANEMENLSHDCTKLSMVAIEGPTNILPLCERIIEHAGSMASLYLLLPIDTVGSHMHQAIYERTADVLRALKPVVSNALKERNVPDQLRLTGLFWEACERLSSLPTDGRQNFLKELTDTAGLVDDALTELEEFQAESSTENSENVVEFEMKSKAIPWCFHLTKAAKATCKRLRENVSGSDICTNHTVALDDQLLDIVFRISPAVDDVVSLFHEEWESPLHLLTEAAKLSECLNDALTVFRNSCYCNTSDNSRTDFLLSAVHHNLIKLQAAMTSYEQST